MSRRLEQNQENGHEAGLNLLKLKIWSQVRDGFARRHGNAIRDLWLKHTRPLSFSRGLFVLGVPNLFIKEWIEKKYVAELEEIFKELTGSPMRILVRTDGHTCTLLKETGDESRLRAEAGVALDSDDPVAAEPRYSRFVVRPECKIACSAFDRILRDAPGSTFNPLLLYGPAKVGKTHLVRHFVEQARKSAFFSEVKVIDALRFASEFSRAARVGDRVRFRGSILRGDLLVVEEAHRLKNKLKTQLELLSILKYLVERQRQVVITSRHHPRDIDFFEDPLSSFFLSGMVVSISGYSVASQIEILSQKIAREVTSLQPTLVEAVARIGSIDLRRKQDLLRKVVAMAREKDEAPTSSFFRTYFPQYEVSVAGEDRVERIITLVSRSREVDKDQIASNCKVRKVVEARYLVIYLATTLLKISSRRISRWLGNISPSVVPYARRKVEKRRQEDPLFDNMVLDLQSEIEGGQRYLF